MPRMRVVTWNMNHCMRRPESRRRAWDYLKNDLRADLALLQEASPPTAEALTSVFRPIDATKPRLAWGSAVLTFGTGLRLRARPRVPLAATFAKSVTGAELPDSH